VADACHGRKGQLRSGDVWWFPLFFSDFGIPRDSMRQVGDFNPSQEYEKSISPIESRGIPKSQKKNKSGNHVAYILFFGSSSLLSINFAHPMTTT
jgi:hypothetical protein